MKKLVIGEGPRRAVLVHGNGLCGEFPFAEQLATRGVQSVLLTLPGFRDAPPLAETSWPALVEAVVAEIPQDAALIGHSLGGLVALLAAARLPKLRKLILLEPAIFPFRAWAKAAAKHYAPPVATFQNWNGGLWRVADPGRYPREMIELFEEGARNSPDTGRALITELPSLYPLPIESVSARTLLVTGQAVGWRGRVLAMLLSRHLAHTQRFILPDAGHWLVNEHDDLLAAAVVDFLEEA